MKQIKMILPNYPMLAYFMNMFNVDNTLPFTLCLEGPTTETIPVTITFNTTETPDYEFIRKKCAASGGSAFTIVEYPIAIEPQQYILA